MPLGEIKKEEAKEILFKQGKSDLINVEIENERKYNAIQRDRSETQLILKEWSEVIKMSRWWSHCLLGVIVAIVLFDFFVIIAVGYGWMKFNKEYIVPFFIGESFLKTVALAFIVVKFLFDKETLKKSN